MAHVVDPAVALRARADHDRSTRRGRPGAPGVVAVFTGKDFEDLPALPCAWQAGGVENFVNTPRVLEIDRVTFTGAGVAAVVAESEYAAEDALELIEVDYEPLAVVVDAKRRQPKARRNSTRTRPTTSSWTGRSATRRRPTGRSAEADVVVKQRLVNQRLIPNPMEPRGAAAQYEPATGEYTVWMTSQEPHIMRLLMTAFVFGIPETKMRCIAPAGRRRLRHEDLPLPRVRAHGRPGREVGRPVKWIETRRENYVATTHGRDHVTDLEVGAKRDGTITALKVKTYANLGGVLSTIAPGIPTTLYGRMLSGAYRIPNIHCQVLGVYTNTGMVDAYRGAGRPEATYVVERAMDLVARELGLDPVEVRRKNFIPPDVSPTTPGILRGLKYDSGDYEKALDRALEIVGYEDFRREQEEAREARPLLGIGFSTYVEICGVAPSAWIGRPARAGAPAVGERQRARPPDRQGRRHTGSQSHGQGHETTIAQVVADELGIPIEDVTRRARRHLGHPVRLRHLRQPQRRRRRGRCLQQRCRRSRRRRAGSPPTCSRPTPKTSSSRTARCSSKARPTTRKTIQEIAGAAALGYDLPEGMEPFLDDTTYYDPPNCTFPFGTHIGVVEVDAETGEVTLKRYIAVDDVGKVINPMIVDGQVHGGIAQGIAQALWEDAVYDENGQLLTGSMMDYAVPKAEFFPPFELDRTETPTDVNPLGVKGAGETGTIASTPAVVNAVMDALAPFGIRHIDMPLTPERVWRAMRQAKG